MSAWASTVSLTLCQIFFRGGCRYKYSQREAKKVLNRPRSPSFSTSPKMCSLVRFWQLSRVKNFSTHLVDIMNYHYFVSYRPFSPPPFSCVHLLTCSFLLGFFILKFIFAIGLLLYRLDLVLSLF